MRAIVLKTGPRKTSVSRKAVREAVLLAYLDGNVPMNDESLKLAKKLAAKRLAKHS